MLNRRNYTCSSVQPRTLFERMQNIISKKKIFVKHDLRNITADKLRK